MQKLIKYSPRVTGTLSAFVLVILSFLHRQEFLSQFPRSEVWWYTELLLCAVLLVVSWLSWRPEKTPDKKEKLLSFLLFLIVPLGMECAVELCNGNMLWDIDIFGNILMNYLINLLICMLLFGMIGSLRCSLKASVFILEIFAIANMYVKEYKGSPLLPWDLASIRTAANVAHAFSFEIHPMLILSVTIALVMWKISMYCINARKDTFYRACRAVSIGIFTVAAGIYYGTDIMAENFSATPDFFNQTRGYEAKGAVAEFIVNTKYLSLQKPDDYDPDTLEEKILSLTDDNAPSILETASKKQNTDESTSSTAQNQTENPNIIVIMNEAFSDLSVIGDFQTNEDYLPFIHSLEGADNCIQGYSYVSVIGTGTSNTEYEFLTGNSMAFLPIGSNAYQLYVDHTQPSLVSTLKSQGYSADAFHPYYKKNWNRPAVYENMGFESFTGIEDMESYEKLRLFVSDACDFQTIEQMYAERDESKPFFLFNITMQNHSSYDQTANFIQQIELKDMNGEYPLTNQYLSLIKETDDAFASLISYFNNVEEPTVILMYGDHQPFIEDAFYEEVMGKSLNELSDEEQQKRYITRFVLWANYDIPEGFIDQISVNYLSTLLAQVTGTELTSYQKFLNTLYQDVPVITAQGCIDKNGEWFVYDDETAYYNILNIYEQAAYNNLIEDEKRINRLFYLKEDDESQ